MMSGLTRQKHFHFVWKLYTKIIIYSWKKYKLQHELTLEEAAERFDETRIDIENDLNMFIKQRDEARP
eukprot:UN14543